MIEYIELTCDGIADKEARLLTVTGDGARTHLINDIAALEVRRGDILAALVGDADRINSHTDR